MGKQNTENIAILNEYFPKARFIIIVRDIRDIAISWRKKWSKSMTLTASKWNNRMNFVENADNIMWIKYEDLIEHLEKTTVEICNFLKIGWEKGMLSHHMRKSEVIDGKINYGKKVVSDNKEKWRSILSKNELKRIEEISFKTLIRFSYQIEVAKNHKEITFFEKYVGILHDLYASLFVGNKFKSINSFKERIKEIKRQIKVRSK